MALARLWCRLGRFRSEGGPESRQTNLAYHLSRREAPHFEGPDDIPGLAFVVVRAAAGAGKTICNQADPV